MKHLSRDATASLSAKSAPTESDEGVFGRAFEALRVSADQGRRRGRDGGDGKDCRGGQLETDGDGEGITGGAGGLVRRIVLVRRVGLMAMAVTVIGHGMVIMVHLSMILRDAIGRLARCRMADAHGHCGQTLQGQGDGNQQQQQVTGQLGHGSVGGAYAFPDQVRTPVDESRVYLYQGRTCVQFCLGLGPVGNAAGSNDG